MKKLKKENGSALAMVLILLGIVSIYIAGINFLASNEAKSISRHRDAYQADYVALSVSEIMAYYVLEQTHFANNHDLNVDDDVVILKKYFDNEIKPLTDADKDSAIAITQVVKKPHGLTIKTEATINSTHVERRLRINDQNVVTNRIFPREKIVKADTDFNFYKKAATPQGEFENRPDFIVIPRDDFEEDRLDLRKENRFSYNRFEIEEGGALVINTNDEDIVLKVRDFIVHGDLILEDDGRLIIFVEESMHFTTPFLNRSDNIVIISLMEGNKTINIDIGEEFVTGNRNRFYGYIYAVSNSGNVNVRLGQNTEFHGGIISDSLELVEGASLQYRPPLKASSLRSFLTIDEPLNLERGLYE